MGDSTFPSPLARANSLETPEHGSLSIEDESAGLRLAAELLTQIFRHLDICVPVRLWSGSTFTVGRRHATDALPPFTYCFKSPSAVVSLVLGRDPLRLAEAYFRGDVDIEGDLFAALALKNHLESLKLTLGERWSALTQAMRLRSIGKRFKALETHGDVRRSSVRTHTREANREAIHFHYDVSNDFYKLWLDEAMVYSCGYFEQADVSLDDAQQAKLDHICRKLLLQPGERFLDVGCGWGALVMHAARRYGVRAHGITLSANQLELARERIAAAGLEDRVTVELRDYRELDSETYDKVASVGMFEHVGLKNLPTYFETVRRVLSPGGLFLNHGITHQHSGWNRNLSTEFINRYVFPDAQLDAISNIQRFMEDARFEIADVEGLRPHYALTLRAWVRRLEERHARAKETVSEATYRVWRLYMAASALEFESGNLGIYQILARKRGAESASLLPLTRRHLYEQ